MIKPFTRIVLGMPFKIAAGLFGFYLIFGFFLVDPLAKRLLPWVGEHELASQLSVDRVEFNPLTLEATVTGLKLSGMDGRPMAGFDRLYANLEASGFLHLATRLKDIRLDGPRAMFVIHKGGQNNWEALIAKLNEDKKPPRQDMARLLIDHIDITNGDLEYVDEDRKGQPFHVQAYPLGIELEGLSTLPEDRGNYQIVANLPRQQGKLSWKGDIALNPVFSEGDFALDSVSLPSLQHAIKVPLKFRLDSGTLSTSLHYRVAMLKAEQPKSGSEAARPDQLSAQVSGANLVVQQFSLSPSQGGHPVLTLAEAKIGDANLNLDKHSVSVADVHVNDLRVAAIRNELGVLDLQTLFAAEPVQDDDKGEAAKPAKAKHDADLPNWKIAVASIGLNNWSARLTDEGYVRPLHVEVDGLGVQAALKGEAGKTLALKLEPVNGGIGPVRLLSGEQEVARLNAVKLSNASFDLAGQRLDVGAVALSGLNTALAVDRSKKLNWQAVLERRHVAAAPAKARPAVKQAESSADKFALNLARLSVDGVNVVVSDNSASKPVRLDIVDGHAAVRNVSLDLNRPVAVDAGLSIKQGGKLNIGGQLLPAKSSGHFKLKLTDFSFLPFAPYVNQVAKLNLFSGAASANGTLDFAPGRSGMDVGFAGGVKVDDLAITEEETSEAFLGWKRLSSDSLEFGLHPGRLHMNELVAVNPFGKVIIYEDKSLNLKRILRTQTEAAAADKPAAPGTTPAGSKPDAGHTGTTVPQPAQVAADAFRLDVERLRIESANAEFADLSLTPQFGTRMHDLSGVVTGLSNDPETTAIVELDGKVDDYGSARVRGSIQPFKATDFTDLSLTFRNLEMTRLTPYSGKFAGRKIDSGRLSVDLEYKIKHRQLEGTNKFVINKLRLGERVDSKDAMNLPLDLAIALLEDSNGVIDLDLPISGSLDDPQFSYGRIVWKAVVNVLTKIVTAPFRAIGNLLGISADKLQAVEFDFGDTGLAPPEKEILVNLSQALAKRPALTLDVTPAYATKGDTRAIQELWIRRDVANMMGQRIEPGKEPGPVDPSNAKAQKALEKLYDGRFQKKGGLKAIKAEYEKPAPDAKPVYVEMLERLTTIIPVTDDELKRMGKSRGEAIKAELVKDGVDPARIRIAETLEQAAGEKMVACKMRLGARQLPIPAGTPETPPSSPAVPTTLAPAR